MRALPLILLFIVCSCLAFRCKDTPTPPTSTIISLAAADVSCTEAWLKVTLANVSPPQTVVLRRDNQIVQTIQLTTSDSTVVDTGLTPRRTHLYKAFRFGNNTPIDSSIAIPITTLDTTSHDFTWQIDTLGDGNSSVLYDVAIINDTLAYAVGEIYKRDSLGNWDPNAYNMAKWNGLIWEPKRIPFVGSCSAVNYPPIKAIWVISANQVLVTNGGAIVTYNGTSASLDCRMNPLLAGAINKMFATSSQNIYAVGNNGAIIHYISGTWRRVISGTTLPIQDIWGSGSTILAVASNRFQNEGRKLLSMRAETVTAINDSNLAWSLSGLWFVERGPYYVAGAGIHHKLFIADELPWLLYPPGGVTNFFTNRIRGAARNEIIAVGAFGEVVTFNGLGWRNHISSTALGNGSYYGVATKGSLVIAVGQLGPRAVALIGRRDN